MFSTTVDAEILKQTADAFVTSDLKDAGYQYIG